MELNCAIQTLTDGMTGNGIYVNGANTTLINLIIHDVGVGVYFYADSTHIGAAGSLIYGCVCYNNGCEGQTEAHAHSIYGHSALPGTSIKNNIMLNGFWIRHTVLCRTGRTADWI